MRKVLLFIAITSIYHSFLFSQNFPYSVDTIEIFSDILNENRDIIVYKPIHISINDPVNILYLLEGENSNRIYIEVVDRFADSISNTMVIGILNPERRRDMLYSKGADKFLDFLTLELIPFVEKDYKIVDRILNGHSFCGSFTIFALVSKPNSFDCYIATSPTPIMDLLSAETYLKIDGVLNDKKALYFSYGSKDMKQVIKWADKLKNNLSSIKFQNFDWRFKAYKGLNHNNSDMIALFDGLSPLLTTP